MSKTATEWLRAIVASKTVWVTIEFRDAMGLLAEFDAAHRIAYGAARADIETKCTPVHEDGRAEKCAEDIRAAWYDLRQPADPEDAHLIATALEYLDGRGLIKRHPMHTHWVKVRDARDATPAHSAP